MWHPVSISSIEKSFVSTPDLTAQTWGPFRSTFSRYLEFLYRERKRPERKANHSPSSNT